MAVWASLDSSFNKVVGVGIGGAFDDDELEAAGRAFAERHAPVQLEVSMLTEPEVVERLSGGGYALTGFENLLGLPSSEVVLRR